MPELGTLHLRIVPAENTRFRFSPARSLHAAILRRLELISPDLSASLHDPVPSAPSTQHSLTVSTLHGPWHPETGNAIAPAGTAFTAQLAALTSEAARALDLAFHPQHPLGREPLILEHVPFQVVSEETYWDNLATYASLLTQAKPERRIALEFHSPTRFKTNRPGPALPEPGVCLGGYLRKWNAFSPVPIAEDPLTDYVNARMWIRSSALRPAVQRLGRSSEHGFAGRVEWEGEGGYPLLLRQVNALVDFACYCGTGMKTALGMGQTRRLNIQD